MTCGTRSRRSSPRYTHKGDPVATPQIELAGLMQACRSTAPGLIAVAREIFLLHGISEISGGTLRQAFESAAPDIIRRSHRSQSKILAENIVQMS